MKKLLVALSIAVVAAGAIVTNLWLELRAERVRANEIATGTATAELMQRASATASPSTETVPSNVAAVMPPSAATPVPVTAPAAGQAPQPASDPPAREMLEMMASPAGQDSMRKMIRSAMSDMYPDIEREVGLTAQEKERLFDLLSSEGMESTALMLAGGRNLAETRELQRKMVEAEQARQSNMAALLGSRYPKWEEYQSTEQAREEVRQLDRVLAAAGNPLSHLQSTALVDAFAREQRRSDKENREWSRSASAINSPDLLQEMMDREAESQKRLLDVAAPILQPAQLDRFRRQAEQDTAMARAMMDMMTGGARP